MNRHTAAFNIIQLRFCQQNVVRVFSPFCEKKIRNTCRKLNECIRDVVGWLNHCTTDIILSVVQKDCEFYDGRDFVSIV